MAHPGPGRGTGQEAGPRISVDDSALLEASCNVSATRSRSRSPSSLELCTHKALANQDRLSPSALKPSCLSKCLSFPRLMTGSPGPTGLDPRSLIAAEQDYDQLSMAGNVGLLRSMSARTVDSFTQHMEHSLGSSDSGSRLLAPCHACMETMGGRSTSCPQMTLTVLAGKPDTAVSDSYLGKSPCAEPDLTGEVINDLPTAATTNFPDLIPEAKLDSPDQQNANLPSIPAPDVTCNKLSGNLTRNNETKNSLLLERKNESRDTHRDGNFNVDAREKCLRWLKSISIDAGQ